jgi:hypothetical protein
MTRRKKKTAEPFDRARVEALWAKQVELDMSTAAFCAAEGLDVRTYNRWKGRLIGLRTGRVSEHEPAPTPPPAEPPLVDVTALLTPPARAESGVEVILADGIRLCLAADFDPVALRRAVEALR